MTPDQFVSEITEIAPFEPWQRDLVQQMIADPEMTVRISPPRGYTRGDYYQYLIERGRVSVDRPTR